MNIMLVNMHGLVGGAKEISLQIFMDMEIPYIIMFHESMGREELDDI